MSSNFFQIAQNISNVLVECLPPEYDSSMDEIRSIHIENSCDLQRLFEENIQRNNTSYRNRGKSKGNDRRNESDEDFTGQSNLHFSKVFNTTSYNEFVQNTEIQQIHEIRITTPEWLRRAKDEFCEIQDKRDVMGLHELAIARVQECNRALRSLHTCNNRESDYVGRR